MWAGVSGGDFEELRVFRIRFGRRAGRASWWTGGEGNRGIRTNPRFLTEQLSR